MTSIREESCLFQTRRRQRVAVPWAWRHVVAIVTLMFQVGCFSDSQRQRSFSPGSGEDTPMRIVTTSGMVTDIVREVVGPRGEVVGLMGEGVDPHLYRPTSNDVKQLARADVIFFNGLSLEGRLEATLEQLQRRGRSVFAVTDCLAESERIASAGAGGHSDPHVWMDVGLWRRCTRHVAEILGQLDPRYRDDYLARSAAYEAKLEELDAYIRQVIASIPEERRVLVTAHDAFQYFSRAYEIPVRSAQGISTESEPGVHDINQLVAFLVERKIEAIFVETSVSESNLQAVIEGAKSRGGNVSIGGELFSDAMGPAGTYEGTYVGMLDHNATTIARALGGQIPTGGWRGLLAKPSNPLAQRQH